MYIEICTSNAYLIREKVKDSTVQNEFRKEVGTCLVVLNKVNKTCPTGLNKKQNKASGEHSRFILDRSHFVWTGLKPEVGCMSR